MQTEQGRSDGPEEYSLLWRITNFAFSGVVGMLGGSLFISVATRFGMNAVLANLIQAIISIIFNYLWNERRTWGDRTGLSRGEKVKRYTRVKLFTILYNQLLFFGAQIGYPHAVVLAYTISPTFLFRFFPYFPQNTFAYWFSSGAIMIFNYFAGDRYVYGKKGNSANSSTEREE